MKKILAFIFIFTLTGSFCHAQWNQALLPSLLSSFNDFDKIDFINDSVGFVSTGDFSDPILRTVDSGTSWSLGNQSFIFGTLSKIDFTSNVWAYGMDQNTLRRTLNAGINWTQLLTTTRRIERFTDLFFPSSSTGYIVSSAVLTGPVRFDGYIYKTTNFGVSWSTDSIPNVLRLNKIYFSHLDTGYTVGAQFPTQKGVLVTTDDGGNTWNSDTSLQIGELNDVYFINSQIGYVVGKPLSSSSTADFAKTIDGGATWTYSTVPSGTPSTTTDVLSTVHFVSPDTGYVAGNNDRFFKTTNGGTTWTAISYSGTANDLYFNDNGIGFLVGDNSQLLSTNPNLVTNVKEFSTISSESYSISPNPATNFITVNNHQSSFTLELRNSLGQLILSKVVQSGENSIDVCFLEEGVYFVSNSDQVKRITKKLVINR